MINEVVCTKIVRLSLLCSVIVGCSQVAEPASIPTLTRPNATATITSSPTMNVSPTKTPAQPVTSMPTAGDLLTPQGQSESGISGQVLMGPMCPGPVRLDEPCPDQPFSSTFHVFDDQDNQVASYQSDEQGFFQVFLPPGEYIIVPDESAPIIRATQQIKEVQVIDNEITQLTLIFDTGQR